jgi:hypothetical protein
MRKFDIAICVLVMIFFGAVFMQGTPPLNIDQQTKALQDLGVQLAGELNRNADGTDLDVQFANAEALANIATAAGDEEDVPAADEAATDGAAVPAADETTGETTGETAEDTVDETDPAITNGMEDDTAAEVESDTETHSGE